MLSISDLAFPVRHRRSIGLRETIPVALWDLKDCLLESSIGFQVNLINGQLRLRLFESYLAYSDKLKGVSVSPLDTGHSTTRGVLSVAKNP